MELSLRDTISWAQANVDRFAGGPESWGVNDVPRGGWAGIQDYSSYLFFPHVLAKILREMGYADPNAEIRKWGHEKKIVVNEEVLNVIEIGKLSLDR